MAGKVSVSKDLLEVRKLAVWGRVVVGMLGVGPCRGNSKSKGPEAGVLRGGGDPVSGGWSKGCWECTEERRDHVCSYRRNWSISSSSSSPLKLP